MRVLDLRPLHMAEAKDLAGDLEEKTELKGYMKRFGKLTRKKADELADEIRKLDNLKIKEEDIVKIVDFLPKDVEELNKIFKDISLDEKEANDVLKIVGKY
ncbi:hypothetical protein COU62_04115 [Candidatus Pacearchaeota archaeon CG10_big_fil_rev_8_21_14_0_10_35_219]|nr:MAG: hypothetical protein AUJ63_03055 [Candidatus Pacearchaeota archaeon CG1_02_35_32]PIO07297.1 MAG: hypothetical protein COU62_04115 [Candidatus Pacearchaeota archaeon CG10_big_fil_rev_8_21_14_0_10_35_219]PIY81347.1 MAG: hypothetical protein COY79_03660 [Candidatus Pacearchaeota archaeon CG_4_10_14_0_8_um_filter_35_169]PIZ79803.1 MAG: hypothetical protein COY00_03165 [Candidatus Pacearchaeota archaeon CG_4_10_14_0_2_um_filter_35_33]PJA69825.1 MAG: hypothetical protein CO155_03070 [Candidat